MSRLLRITVIASLVLVLGVGVASAGTPTSALGNKDLAQGMRGVAVKTLQTDLTIIGYPVAVTGVFGKKTTKEVKAFQRHSKLTADGVVGPETKKALVTALNKLEGDPSTGGTSTGGSGTGGTGSTGGSGGGSGSGSGGGGGKPTGGTGLGAPTSGTKFVKATLLDGLAFDPKAPAIIQDMLAAANRIAFLPYLYGGGHQDYKTKNGKVALDGWASTMTLEGDQIAVVSNKYVAQHSRHPNYSAYDCSGSVSFALHADGAKYHGKSMLSEPLDSEQFARYGVKGKGTWITVYTDPSSHAYVVIAGLRFDTVAQSFDSHEYKGFGVGSFGDRWTSMSSKQMDNDGYAASAFEARHPAGW